VQEGVVNVVGPDDLLQRREVEIAWAQESFVCIAAGIEEGEQVVVSELRPAVEGAHLIPSPDAFETRRVAEIVGASQVAEIALVPETSESNETQRSEKPVRSEQAGRGENAGRGARAARADGAGR